MKTERLRPIKADGYVYCDFHGEVHYADADFYQMGEADCCREVWRSVYVAGTKGETF